MKKIAIVIPCYNVEKYIDRCFDSLKSQTIGIEQMELIFVDDASSDSTYEKLLFYERQFPESVIVIQFEENRHQSIARNVGMEYATATYIGFVDADDFVEPQMYEKMVDTIEKYGCDFVECRWDFARDENTRQPSKLLGETGYMDLTIPEIRRQWVSTKLSQVSMCDKVFRKDFLVESEIFCPPYVRHEDCFFCYLTFLHASSCYYLDYTYYHYYVNPKGGEQRRASGHQLDPLDVMMDFLSLCMERGLVDKYKDEVEWLFLEQYYVYMLWEIFDELPERAYDIYLQMKDNIYRFVPDYKTNPYRFLEGNEFDHMMLKMLDIPLDRQQFMRMKDHIVGTIKVNMMSDF